MSVQGRSLHRVYGRMIHVVYMGACGVAYKMRSSVCGQDRSAAVNRPIFDYKCAQLDCLAWLPL